MERRLKPRDTSIEQKTKLLAELDPQVHCTYCSLMLYSVIFFL